MDHDAVLSLLALRGFFLEPRARRRTSGINGLKFRRLPFRFLRQFPLLPGKGFRFPFAGG